MLANWKTKLQSVAIGAAIAAGGAALAYLQESVGGLKADPILGALLAVAINVGRKLIDNNTPQPPQPQPGQ